VTLHPPIELHRELHGLQHIPAHVHKDQTRPLTATLPDVQTAVKTVEIEIGTLRATEIQIDAAPPPMIADRYTALIVIVIVTETGTETTGDRHGIATALAETHTATHQVTLVTAANTAPPAAPTDTALAKIPAANDVGKPDATQKRKSFDNKRRTHRKEQWHYRNNLTSGTLTRRCDTPMSP